MFLRDLGYGLLRRWYVVVFGLIATIGAGYYTYQVVPITYSTTASLVLIPPKTAVIEGDNPYLYMGGLEQALSVLLVKVGSNDMNNAVIGEQSSSTYEIYKDQSTTGPIMVVEAIGDTPQESVRVLRGVISEVPGSLKTMQDELKIPAPSMISVSTIAVDSEAAPLEKDRLRLVLVVVAGAGTLALLLTALLDHLLIQRRRRKALAGHDPKASKRGSRKEPTREPDVAFSGAQVVVADDSTKPVLEPRPLSAGRGDETNQESEQMVARSHESSMGASSLGASSVDDRISSTDHRG